MANQSKVSWFDKHLFLTDALKALVAILGVFLIVSWSHADSILMADLRGVRVGLYGAASAGCAALLGFIITSITMLISIVQTPYLVQFRHSEAFDEVHDTYFSAIYLLAGGCVYFLILIFLDTDTHPNLWLEALGVSLLILIGLRVFRCLRILDILVRSSAHAEN